MTNKYTGSETPKSALTFQQFSSNGKNSTPEQHSSHTGANRNGHTQKTSIPSSFLEEFGRDGMFLVAKNSWSSSTSEHGPSRISNRD